MKVSQLARLLDCLVQGLDGVVGTPVTADLKKFQDAMRPFADQTVNQFLAHLAKCAEQKEPGPAPGSAAAPKAGKKSPASKLSVNEAVGRVRDLLDQINQGTVTNARIDEALSELGKLTKPNLDEILVALRIADKVKKKEDAVGKIRQVLRNQLEMFLKGATQRHGD